MRWLQGYGPNNFVRYFNGSAGSGAAVLDVRSRYRIEGHLWDDRGERGAIIGWRIANVTGHKAAVDVLDAYSGRLIRRYLEAQETAEDELFLREFHNWYDLIVTVAADSTFKYRLAGQVETGRESFSDQLSEVLSPQGLIRSRWRCPRPCRFAPGKTAQGRERSALIRRRVRLPPCFGQSRHFKRGTKIPAHFLQRVAVFPSIHLMTRNLRIVICPDRVTSVVSRRTASRVPGQAKNRTPSPSNTGTRRTRISSIKPFYMHWRAVSAPITRTFLPPAAVSASRTALRMSPL